MDDQTNVANHNTMPPTEILTNKIARSTTYVLDQQRAGVSGKMHMELKELAQD